MRAIKNQYTEPPVCPHQQTIYNAQRAFSHSDMKKVVWRNINTATGEQLFSFNYQKPDAFRPGQVIVGAFSGEVKNALPYTCEVLNILD
jgi:hypothetical protein